MDLLTWQGTPQGDLPRYSREEGQIRLPGMLASIGSYHMQSRLSRHSRYLLGPLTSTTSQEVAVCVVRPQKLPWML